MISVKVLSIVYHQHRRRIPLTTMLSSGNPKLFFWLAFYLSFCTMTIVMKAIGERIRMSNTQWEYIILNSYKISIQNVLRPRVDVGTRPFGLGTTAVVLNLFLKSGNTFDYMKNLRNTKIMIQKTNKNIPRRNKYILENILLNIFKFYILKYIIKFLQSLDNN